MSLLSSALSAGDLVGVIYTFQSASDVLPVHTHGPNSAHITIVARGSVRVEVGSMVGEDFVVADAIDLTAGACVDTEAGMYHRFTALADNSRIYNIVKARGGAVSDVPAA